MNTKNLMVSFIAMALTLFLAVSVSASFDVAKVTVDGINVSNDPSIVAGETVTVKVYFDSNVNASDVTVEAEIECDKEDVEAETVSFDVEDGNRYKKVLNLEVPFDLKDELSNEVSLNIKISGDGYKNTTEYTLKVQRPSYNIDIKSIATSQTVEAGETLPVDIVLKNLGYNNLDDLYVKVSISELGLEKTAYFGDLVALEECDCLDDEICTARCGNCVDDDDDDTVYGRLLLKIPYGVSAGTYTVDVEVSNDDTKTSEVKEVVIKNDLLHNTIIGSNSKTVAVGEEAEYKVIVVNPTNKLKVYRLITESAEGFSSNAKEAVVAVPAGSSKTVLVTAYAKEAGKYDFAVNVFSDDNVVETVTLSLNAEGEKAETSTDSVVALTVGLAIVFLVLLVVLIVLITKKSAKTEEFGESYY